MLNDNQNKHMNPNQFRIDEFLGTKKHKMVGSYKGDVKRLGKYKYSNDNSLLVGKYKIIA
jgi:hypothetical protein